MDIRNCWCNSDYRETRLGECYGEIRPVNTAESSSGASKLRWKVLWMKFKKEKKKMFESSAHVQVPYDAYTYSQNFDQGFVWDEPDNLSRSFSVRFADPSRIFVKKTQV